MTETNISAVARPESRCRKSLSTALAGCLVMAATMLFGTPALAEEPEIVITASTDDAIEFWEHIGFWGKVNPDQDLLVPRAITVAINHGWAKRAAKLRVQTKKALFFRHMVPLVLVANDLVLHDRAQLEDLSDALNGGRAASSAEREWLADLAVEYRLRKVDAAAPLTDDDIPPLIDDLLLRVDMVSPSLALGQAAAESGYGTSRFSLEGNALFGQWTYSGKGIKPKEQRAEKGDYRIAAFDWPLDSLKAYMKNLNTHPSYKDLRLKRAQLRRDGSPQSGMVLADTLLSYSEKGQDYVDLLRAIIRKNGLEVADTARLSEGGITFLVGTNSPEEAAAIGAEIDQMRANGDLDRVIASMELDPPDRVVE